MIEHSFACYLVFKDPEMPNPPPLLLQRSLFKIMQPTLVITDGENARAQVRTTTKHLEVLTHCKSVTLPREDPSNERARAMVEYWREHSWLGCMSADGIDPNLPVLTRLSGGFGAWRGTLRQPEESVQEHAHASWIKAKTALKIGLLASASLPTMMDTVHKVKEERVEMEKKQRKKLNANGKFEANSRAALMQEVQKEKSALSRGTPRTARSR